MTVIREPRNRLRIGRTRVRLADQKSPDDKQDDESNASDRRPEISARTVNHAGVGAPARTRPNAIYKGLRLGQAAARGWLGQRKVVLRARATLLFGAEFRVPHRGHQAPVMAHRTPLESQPAQTEGLDGCAWHPNGREQMAIPAADDQPSADWITTSPHSQRLCKKTRYQQQPTPPRTPSHIERVGAPEVRPVA